MKSGNSNNQGNNPYWQPNACQNPNQQYPGYQQPPYQQTPAPGQFQYPPSYNAPQQRRSGSGQQNRTPTRKTNFGLGCGCITVVLLFFFGIGAVIASNKVDSTQTPTPTSTTGQAAPIVSNTTGVNLTATSIDTASAATPTPSQGPDLQTVKSMLYNATFSESAKVDNYSQQDAVVQISDVLGTALCCDVAKGAAQEEIFRIEKAFYSSNVYMSSLAVTIYGTIRDQNGNDQGTGPLAKATLTNSTASTIDWTFATSDGIWQSYDDNWLSPSLNY